MNLVGKIFIVLIFVMSLLWMGFSVAVYATHRNWKDIVENPESTAEKPLGLKYQVEHQKERNDELKVRADKLDAELTTERAAKRQALMKLETDNGELQRQLDEQDKRNADLVKEVTDALAGLKATQEAEAALRLEIAGGTAPDGAKVVGLREEIRQAREDRDKHFKEMVDSTEELHQVRNDYQGLKDRNFTLAADLAKANEVLRIHDLKPEPTLYQGEWSVEGVVLDVGANGLIEISIGADDGLLKGQTLELVRQTGGMSTYLGRAEVTETSPDKAVCKILPEFLQRPIQRNDRVTSKLK